jgi:large subunit ribosomal protein L18
MSKQNQNRRMTRERLRKRIRRKISGTAERPRFCVSFSGQHIRAQIIDDTAKKTLVSVATTEKDLQGRKPNVVGASEIGKIMADRAKKKGIEAVVFDRGGFRYHGKVKALADSAREGGLKF